MARFSGPLTIQEIGVEYWRVAKAFTFYSDTGLTVVVEKGFETDLASVPQVFRSVVGKIGYWSQPSVIHDLLYKNHREGKDVKITRLQADNMLVEGMRVKAAEYKVSDSDRKDWLVYGGVRMGGLEAWETEKERVERLKASTHFGTGD